MSLLIEALQRASQEKSGAQPPLTTPPPVEKRPTPEADPVRPAVSTGHDPFPPWPDLAEEKPAAPVAPPTSAARYPALSLEPLASPENIPTEIRHDALPEASSLPASPASPVTSDVSEPSVVPVVAMVAVVAEAPIASITRPTATSTDARSAPDHAPPAPDATPDMAHHLLNAGKPSSVSTHKRAIAIVLGAVAALLLGLGTTAYFFLESTSLPMSRGTLVMAPPPPASPMTTTTPPPPPPTPSSVPDTSSAPAPAPTLSTAAGSPPHTPPAIASPPARPATTMATKATKAVQSSSSHAPVPEKALLPTQASPITPASLSAPVIARHSAEPGEVDQAYAALLEGRLDDAAVAYRHALKIQPEDRNALLGLAYIAQRQGQSNEARDLYQLVLRQEPDNPTANAGLLALMADSDRPDAGGRARDLAERNPRSAATHATLGELMAREGRLADAQQAYFKAVALEPDNARYTYNLAVALDRLHKAGLAIQYYERALMLANPSETPDRIPHALARQRVEQLRAALAAPAKSETAATPMSTP